jgi:hypothetical protein
MTQSFAFPTTLYLVPGSLQALSDVSVNPVSGDNGKALVWNDVAGRWQAEQVAYSNLSGAPALPIPVVSGGTGTQTGSITGTGALTFASASNGNVTLSPQGTGKTVIGNEVDINLRSQDGVETGLNINLPNNQGNGGNGIFLKKGDGYFSIVNGTGVSNSFVGTFAAKNNPNQTNQSACLDFMAGYPATAIPLFGVTAFRVRDSNFSAALLPDNVLCYGFWNGNNSIGAAGDPNFNSNSLLFNIMGNGNAGLKGELNIRSTSASTSTTTGALRVAGGIGAQGNLIVGGTRINYANLPTSSTGLAVGDLWRDGDVVKVKL